MTNIYAIVDTRLNKVVYVGLTKKDIQIRLKEHFKDSDRIIKTDYLIKNKSNIIIRLLEQCEDVQARNSEKYYIELYNNPILNIQGLNKTIKLKSDIEKAHQIISRLIKKVASV